jgi:hypothetical protein
VIEVFEHLVNLISLFPHERLSIEVLEVDIEEIRVPRCRWPGYSVSDRRLSGLGRRIILRRPDDLWLLLPPASRELHPFTTRDLAMQLERPDWFAQRIAYCLRRSGAVIDSGFDRRRRRYTPTLGDRRSARRRSGVVTSST